MINSNPNKQITVLDLTDQKGWMCGKVLSEAGADLIKIEPPGGDPGRNSGPFFNNIPNPENSLPWFAFNSNKKGITLNIQTNRGRDILSKLIRHADIVIESSPPGYMESCGLNFLQMRQINPAIVLTSISPFGQTGPYKDYKSCDLIAMAMGGFAYVCGDTDRSPVRISADQAYAIAGVHAAAGSLMAHRFQRKNGEGSWVDISIQECIVRALYVELAYWDASGEVPVRTGPRRRRMSSYLRDLWPCKDGHLGFRILGGRLGAGTLRALTDWMESESMAGILKDYDFENLDMSKITPSELEEWENVICRFFANHTRDEIYQKAVAERMFICPSYTVKDIFEYEQLNQRDFWMDLDYPHLNTSIKQPKGFLKSNANHPGIQRCAPTIGQHNEEILGDLLGFSPDELNLLKSQGVI